MSKIFLFTLVTTLLAANLSWAQSSDQAEVKKATKKNEENKKDVKQESATPQADTSRRYDYLAYGYSKKKNDAITVVASWDIEFEDSGFQQLVFHKSFDKWAAGLGVDISDETKEVTKISGLLGFENYMLMVEQAEISGDINYNGVPQTNGIFKDNKYLDIKFLTSKKSRSGDAVMAGQYYTYERPSVMRDNGVVYYDPKAKLTAIGIGLEYDTVKEKMLNGTELPKVDWYFYNTTMFVYGTLELSDQTRNESHQLAKPTITKFSGLGINGEYELGILFSGKLFGVQTVAKLGYNYQIEGPLMFSGDEFSGSRNVEPTEQFVNHGPNFTFAASF